MIHPHDVARAALGASEDIKRDIVKRLEEVFRIVGEEIKTETHSDYRNDGAACQAMHSVADKLLGIDWEFVMFHWNPDEDDPYEGN